MTSGHDDRPLSAATTDAEGGIDALRREVREVYRELEEALSVLAPRCSLSGRCCRFKEYDHTLFLSGPEAAILLADAPPPIRPLDDGETCPWQDLQGRCQAREARPLGCRVYFCDPAYEVHAPELSERFLARLREIADRRNIPWNYRPLHHHLGGSTPEPG
ncbi:hypothetical protein [Aquisphaera insulae]|uniref:hypothetical protein n=1 Tax=Aquisphaera insulae TaxID=2712864 RepID=UPI0013EC4F19|nr:hypothetical protein [Aquisphaera insulae]